jgi:hypothetical protein
VRRLDGGSVGRGGGGAWGRARMSGAGVDVRVWVSAVDVRALDARVRVVSDVGVWALDARVRVVSDVRGRV